MLEVDTTVDVQSPPIAEPWWRGLKYLRFAVYLALPAPTALLAMESFGVLNDLPAIVMITAGIGGSMALVASIGCLSLLAWFVSTDPRGHARVMLFCACYVLVSYLSVFVILHFLGPAGSWMLGLPG